MTRDQAIGALIFIVCTLILIGYLADVVIIGASGFSWSWIQKFLGLFGVKVEPFHVLFWLIAIPVIIAFCAVMVIGAWIGWTMATTPPPAPIEELEEELEKEEAEAKEKEEAEEKEG